MLLDLLAICTIALCASSASALPQGDAQVTAAASSATSATPSSTTLDLSPTAVGWLFDSTYDPNATYYWDPYTVLAETNNLGIQSQYIWQQRNVGSWLIEYSIRNGIANSTSYLDSLLDSAAFHSPTMDCAISSTDCTIDGGLFQPNELTNDAFNALMVRASISNYQTWFNAMYTGLQNAINEIPDDVPPLVSALLPGYQQPVSSFWNIANLVQGALGLVTFFCPVEGIVESVVAQAVYRDAANSVDLLSETETASEQIEAMIKSTSNDINGAIANGSALGQAYYQFVQDLTSVLPTDQSSNGNGPVTVQEVEAYDEQMVQYATSFQNQLGSVLSNIFANGFAQGGLISQILHGDWVQTPATTTSNWTNNMAYQAQGQMIQSLGEITVSLVLSTQPQPVFLFKRGTAYPDQGSCQNSFGDNNFNFAQPLGTFCNPSALVPGTWDAFLVLTFDPNVSRPDLYTCMFQGVQGLANSASFGLYNFNSTAFTTQSLTCSNIYTLYQTTNQQNIYNQPQLGNLNPSNSIEDVSCLYNTPVCDAGNPAVISACTNYRNDISNLMLQPGYAYHGPEWASGQCTEYEVLYYCAQQTAINMGQMTQQDVANQYFNYFVGLFAPSHWDALSDQEGGDLYEFETYPGQ